MSRVYPRTSDLKVLTELKTVDNYLDGAKVMLFKNDIVPTKATVLGDLVAADFSGYAISSAVVWGTPFIDANGNATVQAASVQFTQTADTVSNTVHGWGLVGDPGGTPFLAAVERFATPVAMLEAADGLVVDPTFQLS